MSKRIISKEEFSLDATPVELKNWLHSYCLSQPSTAEACVWDSCDKGEIVFHYQVPPDGHLTIVATVPSPERLKINLVSYDAEREDYYLNLFISLRQRWCSKHSSDTDGMWAMLHPSVVALSRSRYETGHFADAVKSALKAVNARAKEIVKTQTGKELDGSSLMQFAFSERNPIIKLTPLVSESDRNIQLGYMQIFAGAMTGIRNPKAHDNLTIDSVRAIHLLYLTSLLMYKLDESTT